MPVDIVANQIIATIPSAYQQAKNAKNNSLFVSHACTSSINPIIWKEVMEYLMAYFKRSPYETRVANPKIRMIK